MTLSNRDVKGGNKDWLTGRTVQISQGVARGFNRDSSAIGKVRRPV
jgi:hypothetical protein